MGTTFGISDFWDRLGGQGLIMIGWWYSGKPLTNHKQRLSTKRSHKSLRCEPVPTALIVSVIGNSISLKAAYDCLTQGAIYVPCKWTDSVWLWRWLPHRLSKRQSLSTTTVLFRTTFTRTIKLNLLLKWLLGSNLWQLDATLLDAYVTCWNSISLHTLLHVVACFWESLRKDLTRSTLIKPHANRRNIVGQQLPTLFGVVASAFARSLLKVFHSKFGLLALFCISLKRLERIFL